MLLMRSPAEFFQRHEERGGAADFSEEFKDFLASLWTQKLNIEAAYHHPFMKQKNIKGFSGNKELKKRVKHL